MRKILFLCEKPSLLSKILQQYDSNNDSFFKTRELWVCFSNPATVPVYKYPSDIKYKDYPKCSPVELKWNPGFKTFLSESYKDLPNINFIISQEDFNQSFDDLLVVQDRDHIGAYYGVSILSFVYGSEFENNFDTCSYFLPYHYDDLYSDLDSNLYNKKNSKELFFNLSRAGAVKQYFQFNFNFNSSIFFKEILRYLGVVSDINISKYMLFYIHLLYNKKYNEKFDIPFLDNRLLVDYLYSLGDSFSGSGKFSMDNSFSFESLGSPATKYSIFDNLVQLGLISTNGKFFYPTSLGFKFFSFLNNKTFDIDMPFRINGWSNKSFSGQGGIIPSIDSYLQNMFIGQKRKNNKQLNY